MRILRPAEAGRLSRFTRQEQQYPKARTTTDMSNEPYLYIPRPTARPGDAPDFSYLELSPAGTVDRPPIDARAADIEHLALEMVRVLDDDHEARGPWAPDLDK